MIETEKKRLIRIDTELYKASKIACAVQGIRMGAFAMVSAANWSEQQGELHPGVKGSQQLSVPTYEDLDLKMRLRAASEPGGVSVGVAYGSALALSVDTIYSAGRIHDVSIEAHNIVGEYLRSLQQKLG